MWAEFQSLKSKVKEKMLYTGEHGTTGAIESPEVELYTGEQVIL